MTHTPLTKAEREELQRMHADREAADKARCLTNNLTDYDKASLDCRVLTAKLSTAASDAIPRLLADLDAAEAERDAAQERVDLDIDEFRRILVEMDNLRVRIPVTPEGGRVLYDLVQGVVLRATYAGRQRVPLIAQRDRAESELDAERKMRVEAEAASDRMVAERDALKQAQDGIMHFVDKWLDELDEVDEPTEDPVSRSMRAREIALKWGEGIAAERDALKAKLAESKLELQGYKMRIDADEWAATERNQLQIDLAEVKAKLAALVEACDAKDSLLACYRIGKRPSEALFKKLDKATAAIAAARGGAQ